MPAGLCEKQEIYLHSICSPRIRAPLRKNFAPHFINGFVSVLHMELVIDDAAFGAHCSMLNRKGSHIRSSLSASKWGSILIRRRVALCCRIRCRWL
jgi:hypothetical protein